MGSYKLGVDNTEKERILQSFLNLDERSDPPFELRTVFYYPELNRFMDADGNILHHITELVSWWIIDLFKQRREYMIVVGLDTQIYYELYYKENDE